jgi:hypothetical protein
VPNEQSENFMRGSSRYLSLLGGVSAIALLAACGAIMDEGTGTLGISMTDAPACGYDAVNVTVRTLRIHQSASAAENDNGWKEVVLSPARKINLLQLTNGTLEDLGQIDLAAGRYSQLRLILDPNSGANNLTNSVVLSTTPATERHLDTPAALKSGIKLTKEFEIKSGKRINLVLDFDACRSVIKNGNAEFALRPVVQLIPTAPNGITGYIDPALLGANVAISAQQNGTVVRATVPKDSGEFFLARLEPGDYDVVLTADNRATTVVAAVPIATASSIVTLSSTGTPLVLPVATTAPRSISGTVTLKPADTSGATYVAAQQRFLRGSRVTVKYGSTDLSTGAYTLAGLPTAAPYLARYSAQLPLVFNAQAQTTPGNGKYSIEATAAGYTAQTAASVDISAMDRGRVDFTLVP